MEQQPLFRPSGDRAFIHDNQIFLCGRIGNQVKRNGQFVSLVKLSNMISSLEAVECCFSVFDHGRLHTFVQTASETVDRVSLERHILKQIRDRSSDSYVPDRITILPSFPITEHGKTDSKRLVETRTGASTCVLSDKYIKQCWNISLASGEVNCNKTYTELGGDSFTAVYFVNRLLKNVCFGKNTSIGGDLYEKLFTKTLDGSNLSDVQSYIHHELKCVFNNPTYSDGTSSLQIDENLQHSGTTKNYKHQKPNYNTFDDIENNDEVSSLRVHKHTEHLTSEFCSSNKERGAIQELCQHHFVAFSRQLQISTCGCREISKEFDCSSSLSSTYKLNQLHLEWKYNLGKCVDSSALVLFSDPFKKGKEQSRFSKLLTFAVR